MQLKHGALALIAVLLALSIYSGINATLTTLDKLNGWQRLSATVRGMVGENLLEVEVRQGEQPSRRLRVTTPPESYYSLDATVVVLQNPAAPQRGEVLDHWHMWQPIASQALVATALMAFALWLWRSRLGQDLTRKNGAWVATPLGSAPLSLTRPGALLVTEAGAARTAVIIWTAAMAIVAALAVAGAYLTGSLFQTALAIFAVGMLLLAASTWATTYSRRLVIDDAGVQDSSIFGTKRATWGEMKSMRLVNLNEAKQRDWDRSSLSSRRSGSSRPRTLNVHIIADAAEGEIFRLTEKMHPDRAIDELHKRIRAAHPPSETEASEQDGADASDIDQEADAATLAEFAAEKEAMRRAQRRSGNALLAVMLLAAAPFLLGAAYTTYRSVWFQSSAARAEGVVVEKSKDEGVVDAGV